MNSVQPRTSVGVTFTEVLRNAKQNFINMSH